MAKNEVQNMNAGPQCVVGIGASAGGLEALQQLLTYLSSDTGMAFVIIQHLSPDHKSLLADILGKYTSMPVVEAEDSMPIEANHVYTIPPKFNLEVENGLLRLKEFDHAKINHPIDIFFRSLANAYDSRAVAVILSGTGSDGTNGIKAIREQNGVIIVQSPESARFDGMPRNAIATGFEDMVLNPDSIAREMSHIAESMRENNGGLKMTDEDLLSQIFSILKSVTNVNYTFYKKTTILRRIERRMVVTHNRDFSEYVNYLRNNQEEARMLGKEVLIGVTSFFRDPDYFEVLKNNVITQIVRNTPNGEQIRVWVAGCSTGEEAYSIAILFAEVMDELRVRRDIKIFATDLDADSVAFAGRGIYHDTIIEDVSVGRLARFFTRKGNKYIVNHEIRRMIVFAQHNVFQDPPFGRLDLISCRNLLIYFQNVLQKNLFAIFHVALKDKGFLFLGRSESVGDYSDIFRVYCASEKIFIHHASGKEPAHAKLSYQVQSFKPGEIEDKEDLIPEEAFSPKYTAGELDTKVLEKLLPATILIDQQNALTHTYGDTSAFLNIPVGNITLDVFSLIRSDLKIAVSKALKEVRSSGKTVTYDKIPVKIGKDPEYITLTGMPILNKIGEKTGVIAVTFIRNNDHVGKTPKNVEHFQIESAASERISDLEKELRLSQDNLKHTVTELESVNAELQAANEELMTANEELQSSNEELQSVNEELYTVNSEYQAKVTELANLNDDMSNFLSTTLIGIIMVDNQLNIRKYTKYIADEFHVADQDVGRSLRYIAYNFSSIDLMDLSAQVQKSRKTIEMTCVSDAGGSYLLRIAPYRSGSVNTEVLSGTNKQNQYSEEEIRNIEGLVITFVDISKQFEQDQQIHEMKRALQVIEKSNRQKEVFLQSISTDMQASLSTALNKLNRVMKESRHPDQADMKKMQKDLSKMKVSGAYLQSLVTEIYEEGKISSGTAALNEVPVPENLAIQKAAECFNEVAASADAILEWKIQGSENKTAMIDVDRLSLVLTGLLNRSLKDTASGGKIRMTLEVKYPDKNTTMHTYRIEDNNNGSREFRGRMEQLSDDKTGNKDIIEDKRDPGLYVARALVDLMKGKAQVKKNATGTEVIISFTFRIASEEQKRLNQKQSSDYVSRLLYGRNVLIVEDNASLADSLQSMLDVYGIHSEVASDGREAVEMYRNNGAYYYRLMLVDVRIPVLDGMHLARSIRTQNMADAKIVPIIGITADYADGINEECTKAGMNQIIRRPADADELFGVIKEVLDQEN